MLKFVDDNFSVGVFFVHTRLQQFVVNAIQWWHCSCGKNVQCPNYPQGGWLSQQPVCPCVIMLLWLLLLNCGTF